MDVDPREWPGNKTYQNALATVECLRVVNDIAERGVALAKEYTDKLTSDSDCVPSCALGQIGETSVRKGSLTKISVRVT